MTFERPWLLVLLAAVPWLVWLHRRRAPAVVRVASVAPYRAGPRVAERAERRGADPLLVALVAAAAALALAAAGPRVETGSGAVLVLRDASESMEARTAEGTTVGASADARAEALLRDAGVAAERWVLEPGEDLAAKVATARAAGFPRVLLVTDRAPVPEDPAVLAVGPSAPAGPNVAIVRAWLDGDRAHVSLRHFGGEPVRVEVQAAGGTETLVLAGGETADVEVAPPERGGSRTVEIRCDDALDADDRATLTRVGGARRVRFVGESAHVRAALRALAVETVAGDAFDATVIVGGTLGDPPERAVHLAPRSDRGGAAGGLALADGPRDVDHATLVARGDEAFPVPAGSSRLVATGRIALRGTAARRARTLLEDRHGILAAARDSEVAIVLDPDDPAAEWHRDGAFVAAIGEALDLATGGPERIEVAAGPPESESDVARATWTPPDAEAVRAAARRGAAHDLAAPLAAAGAFAAAVAAWLGARRR